MIVIETRFIPLSLTVHCFDNSYVEKQPVAWKEFLFGVLVKRILESMDRCTDHCNIIEVMLKTVSITMLTINLSVIFFFFFCSEILRSLIIERKKPEFLNTLSKTNIEKGKV